MKDLVDVDEIMEVAGYGVRDGAHNKDWVIQEMVRVLNR
ncbi:hypothetical protein LCGC14_1068920 [marine sediment metagenome]|uniref:Uncharacterized protein n=1 Tax=marine sediment metagenome TaxID=412755 RepID=A0A0F9N5W1_9ZZZZ